jgi:two-component system, chemotaxis family, chemotaxis protein CheY
MLIRVLIVDHHAQVRRLVRAFFMSKFGFQICGEAVDGYEAVMKAQLLKPDLIVLEVAIPRLNGVQAAPKLRKLLPKTPIILFTLHGDLLKGCDISEIGVDAVVAKQDGMPSLGASVHTLLHLTHRPKVSPLAGRTR